MWTCQCHKCFTWEKRRSMIPAASAVSSQCAVQLAIRSNASSIKLLTSVPVISPAIAARATSPTAATTLQPNFAASAACVSAPPEVDAKIAEVRAIPNARCATLRHVRAAKSSGSGNSKLNDANSCQHRQSINRQPLLQRSSPQPSLGRSISSSKCSTDDLVHFADARCNPLRSQEALRGTAQPNSLVHHEEKGLATAPPARARNSNLARELNKESCNTRRLTSSSGGQRSTQASQCSGSNGCSCSCCQVPEATLRALACSTTR